MNQSSTNQQGVFINGKAQIIEMLKMMNPEDKERLLKNIRLRDASLARELNVESMTFESIQNLNEISIKMLISKVDYKIMGIALKNATTSLQKFILRNSPNQYAESAFAILQSQDFDRYEDISRAQKRILETLREIR